MGKGFVLAAVLTLSACASAPASAPPAAPAAPGCAVSAEDQAWIDRALETWRFASREITSIHPTGDFGAVFFDATCKLSSPNALSVARDSDATWAASPHSGTITLPDGNEMPAGVTSFASSEDGKSFFVMSTPSVWRAGGVVGDPIDLDTLMVFVLLHEGSHVAQMATYGPRIGAIAERNHLPESFNDDSMQHQFGETLAFAVSIARETELFVQAATTADDATALRLARQARAMMRARAAQYFVGDLAYYAEAEDVFLTFEGSGQWAGYRWLIHPQGMAVAPDLARRAAMRSRWWSQNEGLAIALTLDRLGPANWHAIAFGDGSQTMLQMLDSVLR